MGETARDGRERRDSEQHGQVRGQWLQEPDVGRQAEKSEEGRRGAREDRVGPRRMWGEGRQSRWEKMSQV